MSTTPVGRPPLNLTGVPIHAGSHREAVGIDREPTPAISPSTWRLLPTADVAGGMEKGWISRAGA